MGEGTGRVCGDYDTLQTLSKSKELPSVFVAGGS